MKINFLGDFVAPTVQGLELSGGLLEIIASGDFNSINFEAPILPPPSISSVDKQDLVGSSLYDRVARLPKSGPSLSQDNEGPKWLEANALNGFFCINGITKY